jgi:hypothetical protein
MAYTWLQKAMYASTPLHMLEPPPQLACKRAVVAVGEQE